MAATLPTGEQYAIRSGAYAAVVTEVGATLRNLSYEGRDLVRGFAADEVSNVGRGQQLLPWPNRVRDGRYVFDGVTQQLALSEPDRHNAIHGLARHVPWRLVELLEDAVTLSVRIFPQLGWPGTLEASLTFRLGPDGLAVQLTARNIGLGSVPFGYAAHPYLSVGEETVDEVALTVPARSYLEVDDRLLPVEIRPVDGTELDRRAGGTLGSVSMDTAFTDLDRGSEGLWRVRLERADRYTELWADDTFSWIQIFTGGPDRNWSLAVEPMTCGPDAFNPGPTHGQLLVLAPGEDFFGRWGIAGR
jgi:aldose 1-epimerase